MHWHGLLAYFFVAGLRGLWDIPWYIPSTVSGIRTQQVYCITIYAYFDAR